MGSVPGKLRFRWTWPFWILNNHNVTYQVNTLLGKIMPKWVNGFRLKPYKRSMPENPFQVGVETNNPPTTP